MSECVALYASGPILILHGLHLNGGFIEKQVAPSSNSVVQPSETSALRNPDLQLFNKLKIRLHRRRIEKFIFEFVNLTIVWSSRENSK